MCSKIRNIKKIKSLSFIIIAIIISSCSSTKETTSENDPPAPAQLQNWQEQQKKMQENSERTGLTHDQIRKLDNYAEQKVELVCQIIAIEKQAEQAISDIEANDVKENITNLDNQVSALSREIDAYCDTDPKREYFTQIYKHKVKRCEPD